MIYVTGTSNITEAKALDKRVNKLKRKIFWYERRNDFMNLVVDIGTVVCGKTKIPFEFRKLGRKCWDILEGHIDEGTHLMNECQTCIDKLNYFEAMQKKKREII